MAVGVPHGVCGAQTRLKLCLSFAALGLLSIVLLLTLRVHHSRDRIAFWHVSAAANRSQEELQIGYFEQQDGLNLTPDDELSSLQPTSLQAEYLSQTQSLRMTANVTHERFHWVINSCDRVNWGRTMATTLLSGLMNGLQPETISIAWCRPYDKDKVPSLLFNLRHSLKLEMFYLPTNLPIEVASTLLLSLLVPRLLNAPQYPLLVTEDDIVFSPDAGAKLSWLIQQAQLKAQGAPYFLNLYNPPSEPLSTIEEAVRLYNSQTGTQTLVFPQQQSSPGGSLKQSKKSFWYGTQGMLLSPAMTRYMARHVYQVVRETVQIDKGFDGRFQDQVMKDFLVRYSCSFKYNPAAPCHVFNVEPSLVQHIGTSSALFKPNNGTGKPRVHLAVDFPVPVEFPGDDGPGWW